MIYTFDCEECGRIFVEHPMAKGHPEVCPTCKGDITRIYDAPPLKFKGSGFYSTDSVLSDPTPDEVTEAKISGDME